MQHKLMQAAFSHQNVTLSFVYQIIICLYLYHDDGCDHDNSKQTTDKQTITIRQSYYLKLQCSMTHSCHERLFLITNFNAF